ncbi:MAG: AAA family ATPase [Silicimonas sp.]|nr:AAA family ATPase [Silicimonas sp.]
MQRVMIIGQPGAGKSTLARRLGARTGLPVVHIDLIHWQPGWVERDRAEKTRLCRAVHAREEWIFEGGHSSTWDDRLARCDTLIWLDFPLWLRLWRVITRTLRDYGRSRADLPENCPERFDPDFYRFIWRTRNRSRARMRSLFDTAPAEKRKIRLSTRSQVRAFLQGIEGA